MMSLIQCPFCDSFRTTIDSINDNGTVDFYCSNCDNHITADVIISIIPDTWVKKE